MSRSPAEHWEVIASLLGNAATVVLALSGIVGGAVLWLKKAKHEVQLIDVAGVAVIVALLSIAAFLATFIATTMR